MNYVIDLQKDLFADDFGYQHIKHTVNGVSIAIGPYHNPDVDISCLEVLVKIGKKYIDFIIDDEMADLPIDAREPELLTSEMKTLILRVEDLQQQKKPITEETLFAPELQRLRANKEQGDHKPFDELFSGQRK